jgi:predicted transcriptional regulator
MSKKDPRKLIIGVLKKHPEGLTIASIARITGLHRHTATKYIHELIGAGAIIQRNIGVAKLCYLKKISKDEEKKLLEKLERRRSAEKYSLKLIFSVVLITFLLSEVAILAYENNSLNETLSDNFSINISPLTSSLSLNDSNISQIIETVIENASNNISVETNDSLISVNETSIIDNTTLNNTVIVNDNLTSTVNETQSNNPTFDINLEYPEKITRGEEFLIKAYISNIDSSEAKNIAIDWRLPEGFEITSKSENCGNLEPSSNCVSEINVKTSLSMILGKNDVKIVVKYEE